MNKQNKTRKSRTFKKKKKHSTFRTLNICNPSLVAHRCRLKHPFGASISLPSYGINEFLYLFLFFFITVRRIHLESRWQARTANESLMALSGFFQFSLMAPLNGWWMILAFHLKKASKTFFSPKHMREMKVGGPHKGESWCCLDITGYDGQCCHQGWAWLGVRGMFVWRSFASREGKSCQEQPCIWVPWYNWTFVLPSKGVMQRSASPLNEDMLKP